MAKRLVGRFGYPADQPFRVTLHEDRLDEPLQWAKPRRVFVCSMGDLFHQSVPDGFVFAVFMRMIASPRHTFMVLTKRPRRMRDWLQANMPINFPCPHIWLGVTVESAKYTARVEDLRETLAHVRFLSLEPLLGPLPVDLHGIHWVIVGGETGPGARPMHPAWVRDLRDQCRDAQIPFFFKSWGEYNYQAVQRATFADGDVVPGEAEPMSWTRVGHRLSGRLLDGRAWDEIPVVSGQEAQR